MSSNYKGNHFARIHQHSYTLNSSSVTYQLYPIFLPDIKLFLKRSGKIDRTREGSSSHLRTDQAEIYEVGFAQELLFRNILHLHVSLVV